METIRMNLADLRHPERNVRRHPQRQINEMKRSLKMFGQFRPIVVDENNTILAGNGLAIAMKEAGYTEADVLKYPDLTENQKKKLMIADNQVASLGVDDYAAIEEILKSLEGDFDVPGYDENAIKLLVEEADAVVNSVQSYGVYPQEDTARVNREREYRDENGFTPVLQTWQESDDEDVPFVSETRPAPASENMERTESHRFVVCPHCGEKIYL